MTVSLLCIHWNTVCYAISCSLREILIFIELLYLTAFQYIRQLITAQSTVQNYLRVYMPGISTKSMCFLFFFISSMMYFKVSIFFLQKCSSHKFVLSLMTFAILYLELNFLKWYRAATFHFNLFRDQSYFKAIVKRDTVEYANLISWNEVDSLTVH